MILSYGNYLERSITESAGVPEISTPQTLTASSDIQSLKFAALSGFAQVEGSNIFEIIGDIGAGLYNNVMIVGLFGVEISDALAVFSGGNIINATCYGTGDPTFTTIEYEYSFGIDGNAMRTPFNPIFIIPRANRYLSYWKIKLETSAATTITARKMWIGPGLHPKTGANWTQATIDSGKLSRTEEQVVFSREGVKAREITATGKFDGAEAFGYGLSQLESPQTLQEAYYKCGDTGDLVFVARDLYDVELTALSAPEEPKQAAWLYHHGIYGVFSQRDPIPHSDGDIFVCGFKVREHVSACGGDRTVETLT